jgi:hypothetical protein
LAFFDASTAWGISRHATSLTDRGIIRCQSWLHCLSEGIDITHRSHLVLRDLQLTQALETLLSVSVPSVGGVITGQEVNYRSEGIGFDKRGRAAFESREQASYPADYAEWR